MTKWQRTIIEAVSKDGVTCEFIGKTGRDHNKFRLRQGSVTAMMTTSFTVSDEHFALKKIVADAKRILRNKSLGCWQNDYAADS